MLPIRYPIVARATEAHGAGVSSDIVLDSGRIALLLDIDDTQSSQPSFNQAAAISQACYKFFSEELPRIHRDHSGFSNYGVAVLSMERFLSSYQNALRQLLPELEHAVVKIDESVSASGVLTVNISANGTPQAIDAAVRQIGMLEGMGHIGSVKTCSISVTPYRCSKLTEDFEEKLLNAASVAFKKIVRISQPNALVPTLKRRGNVLTIHEKSELLPERSSECIKAVSAVASGLPVYRSGKGSSQLLAALSKIGGVFQLLSLRQLLQFMVFRALDLSNQKQTPFTQLATRSASSSSSSSSPAHSYTRMINDQLMIQAFDSSTASPQILFLATAPLFACLEEGAAIGTIVTLLEQFEQDLKNNANTAKGRGMDGLTIGAVQAIRFYFEKAQESTRAMQYRLEPAIANILDTPIHKLKTGTKASPERASSCLVHLVDLIKTFNALPGFVQSVEENVIQCDLKPALRNLAVEAGRAMDWSPEKTVKTTALMDLLVDHLLEISQTSLNQIQGMRESLMPLFDLVPIAKIARLRSEGKEEQVRQWYERNHSELSALRDGITLLLDIFQSFKSSGFGEIVFPTMLLLYCNEDESDLKELPSLKVLLERMGENTPERIMAGKRIASCSAFPQASQAYSHLESTRDALNGFRTHGKHLASWLCEQIELDLKSYKDNEAASLSLMSETSSSRSSTGKRRGAKTSVSRGKVSPFPRSQIKKAVVAPVEECASSVPAPAEQPPPRLVVEHPMAQVHDNLLNRVRDYQKTFENVFAKQCWENVENLYKDLMSELVDVPSFAAAHHLSEYVNRVVVLVSLLAEQMVSAHALEQQKPKDIWDRHRIVKHNIAEMLTSEDVLQRFSADREFLESVSGLEMLSRNLRSHQRSEVPGAQLLYKADELLRSPLDVSSGAGSFVTYGELIAETNLFVREQLAILCRFVGIDLNLDLLVGMDFSEGDMSAGPLEGAKPLLKKMEKIQGDLGALKNTSSSSTFPAAPSYLNDASRILGLMSARLERRSEEGNVRNFFKMLATSMAHTLEFCAVTLAGKMGQRDFSQVRWNHFSHNLTNLFEELGFHRLTKREEDFLEACDRVHSLTRYSANYRVVEERDSAQDIYLQLLKRLQATDMTHQAGIGQAGWQSADRSLQRAVRTAVTDVYDRLDIGLGLLAKLLDRLKASAT